MPTWTHWAGMGFLFDPRKILYGSPKRLPHDVSWLGCCLDGPAPLVMVEHSRAGHHLQSSQQLDRGAHSGKMGTRQSVVQYCKCCSDQSAAVMHGLRIHTHARSDMHAGSMITDLPSDNSQDQRDSRQTTRAGVAPEPDGT